LPRLRQAQFKSAPLFSSFLLNLLTIGMERYRHCTAYRRRMTASALLAEQHEEDRHLFVIDACNYSTLFELLKYRAED
jgi:hypothetical protein